ncbi:unnamed protein product [Rotaria sp. Silwood2]|nr:unnamed protein product [Rotaria sp. Silwood2]CAF2652049.1 unnamed protein product [Rotaria sp. Silwood2]CAF2705881.1 unnamed protein product [Rotaria sp. Silwood2]CAF4024250.1 unnamed protein product [Rotaria sp. Silwood2]CAF4248662.1 unnamed protein product [Rotaria sp. Silwood2]
MFGSLTHEVLARTEGTTICHPIPVNGCQSIDDYILHILTGFANQSKSLVIHLSSFFHSFILVNCGQCIANTSSIDFSFASYSK